MKINAGGDGNSPLEKQPLVFFSRLRVKVKITNYEEIRPSYLGWDVLYRTAAKVQHS